MAENNKTRFFSVLYSDKTRVFDQSERAYYPIYIIIISNHMTFQRLQIALALLARAILVVFEKIYSCLFISNCTRKNHVITYTNVTATFLWRAINKSTFFRELTRNNTSNFIMVMMIIEQTTVWFDYTCKQNNISIAY